LKASIDGRVRECFERATKVVQAAVGKLASGLDLVGDAPDLGFEGAATGCQVDQHAAFVGGVACSRDHASEIEALNQGRDRTRVHVEAGTESADGKWRAIQQLEITRYWGKVRPNGSRNGLCSRTIRFAAP